MHMVIHMLLYQVVWTHIFLTFAQSRHLNVVKSLEILI